MLVLALAAVLAPAMGGGTAHAASTVRQAAPEPAGLDARAAYFAERLRASPVYVTDQAPRVMPRSAWPAFLEQAQRTGVPTYVLVLPYAATVDRDELLTAVREKLDRKGLYVLLDADGGGSWLDVSVEAEGVGDLPIQASLDSADEWLPDDATALDFFTAFVDGLRNDGDASGSGRPPNSLYTSPEGRAAESTVTGVLTGLVPALALLIGVPLARRRGSGRRLLVPVAVAVVLAVTVPLCARGLLSDTSSTGDPDPTGRDLELRAERFAAGLREDSVYLDAELPPALTPAQLRSVERRLSTLDVPVYVVAVPLDHADESEGHADLFAERLHRTLGKNGLYVTASVGTFDDISLQLTNYGAKLDESELYDLDDWVAYGPEDMDADPQLHARLLKLAQHIGRTPAGPPGRPYAGDEPPMDPVAEDTLPALLTDPDGPAGLSGMFLAGLAGGAGVPAAVAGLVWLVRRSRRGTGHPAPPRPAPRGSRTPPRTPPGGTPERRDPGIDARPDTRWLRTTARRELGMLREEFTRTRPRNDDQAHASVRDCLEAATLLLDRDGDQHVDSDTGAVDLATGLALIRATLDTAPDERRSIPGTGTSLCTLNPLHGPAPMTSRLAPTPGARFRPHPVCEACGAALGKAASAHRAAAVDRLRLTLPGTRDGSGRPVRTAAYTALPGPLGEAGARGDIQVTALVSDVRARRGVQG
ncbi:hypothetical protein [Streptomyces boluensis]|uniref:TPM domain-containing protein n=1 Tax=Streptomyces boluensis TaxID=1775135 RepID=A0A964XL84_9ACTN|nr:hypothetical protein [Streptomyces boluensis]NBE51487.1 hypothetical protein [Streptomyces boluensis]